MADGNSSRAPYPSPPSPNDRRIADPIAASRPEDIYGLNPSKPDFSEWVEHRVIRNFYIDREEYVPCALCSGGHPKFLSGAVLWSSDGWLRLIGHRCAAKPEHFGVARYEKLKKDREDKERDYAALDWLELNLRVLASMKPGLHLLLSSAKFFEGQQHEFLKGVPQLAGALTEVVRRSDGVLSVEVELSEDRIEATRVASAGRLTTRYVLSPLGKMGGGALVRRASKKPSKTVAEAIHTFTQIIPDEDGDQLLATAIDKGTADTAGRLQHAVLNALGVAERCKDAARFVSETNLDLLARWGQHPGNPIRFSVSRGSQRINFVQADRSRASLAREWPALPDFSHWRALTQSSPVRES